MAILVYKKYSSGVPNTNIQFFKEFSVKIWQPSFTSFRPPFLGYKYTYWWIAHYFGTFKNKGYAAIIAEEKESPFGIIVLTPPYSRWKFMKKNDLQITNVHVDEKYRGQGIAYKMINIALERFSMKDRSFWYITTSDNIPSIKLCEKAGFQLAGKGKKINRTGLKGFHEIKLIHEENAHS